MRALIGVLGILAACTDEPSVKIIAPLPDTSIVASIELHIEGRGLAGTTETKIYVDLQQFTGELIDNTLPADCDDCSFVVGFAGAAITNGRHSVGIYMFKGEQQLATDAVSLVFAR